MMFHFHDWDTKLVKCRCDCSFPKIDGKGTRVSERSRAGPVIHASQAYRGDICIASLFQRCNKCNKRRIKVEIQQKPSAEPWVDDGILPA